MTWYWVSWATEVNELSPADAAEAARDIVCDPDMVNTFLVTDRNGKVTEVDVKENNK